MNRPAEIRACLTDRLQPTWLEVLDESDGHSVPRGSQSHVRVRVVSAQFEGASRLQRHRLVQSLCAPWLSSGLHALAIETYTPDEFAVRAELGSSPPCLGGSHEKPGRQAKERMS